MYNAPKSATYSDALQNIEKFIYTCAYTHIETFAYVTSNDKTI